jgi:hypothetical protein
MMRSIVLFLTLFFFALDLSAQRNYVPAVIATQQGDSLRGFVDYRNWNISPGEIRFKTSLTDKEDQHFGPGEIKGFRLAEPDETYTSLQVKIDITRQDAAVLDRVIPREIQDTLVFMKVLTAGNYHFYGYIDTHGREHYFYDISGKPESIQELEYVKAYIVNSEGGRLFESRAYRQQLKELFKDCPAVAKHASRLSYGEIELFNLFVAYYDCKHPSDKPLEKKIEAKRFEFGVLAGTSFNSFKFYGLSYVFDGTTYSSSTSPLIGASMNILMGKNRKPFSLRS